MAIAFRSAAVRSGDVSGGTTTVARPNGVAAGDLLVALAARSQTAASVSAFTASGWTVARFFAATGDNQGPVAVLYRWATSSEPTTYSFTSSGYSQTDQFTIIVAAWTGVDTSAPFAVLPIKADQSAVAAVMPAPSVDTPNPGAVMVSAWLALLYNSTAGLYGFNPVSSMTNRAERSDVWLHITTASEVIAQPTTTGTRSATFVRRSTGAATTPQLPGRALSYALRAAGSDGLTNVGAIPSAEAFGTPTLTPGEVTVSAAGGIASAEAVGTPTVGPGQQIGPAGGIASAENVGTPAVVPGAATVAPTGIVSAAAFGTPTLTPGGVTVRPTGIASGEAFGTPTVQFGIAEVDLPRAYPRSVIPYPAVDYELVCVARAMKPSGPPSFYEVDPIDWTGLGITDELSMPQKLDASCSIGKLPESVLQRLRNLERLATELWLYRNGKQVFAGPLFGYQVQGETVTLNCAGLLAYLRGFYVVRDLVYAQKDQSQFVVDMIDGWQELPYGNFGLDTDDIAPTGIKRDGSYLRKAAHNVYQRVTELGNRFNGFDISVDPASRKVRIAAPQQGVDRSDGPDAIIFDNRNVVSGDIICAAGPGDIATVGFGIGTADTADKAVFSERVNAELLPQFGRFGVAETFDGVSDQTTCDDYTQGLVDARGDALLVPGPDARTTADADPSLYDVGDTVAYQVHERIDVRGAFRLRKRVISVSDVGREKTSVQFV